jgi:hypothetical protein
MAWTTPRTWVKGDFPTVSRLNADLRDNMNFIGTCFGSRVRASAVNNIPASNQSIDNGFDTEDWDSDNLHNQTANLGRLTINTAGMYFIGATIPWSSVGGLVSNQKRVHIYHNRAGVDTEIDRVQERGINGETNVCTAETMYACLPGDYLRVELWQDTAGAVGINVASGGHLFYAYRISN